MKKVLLCLSLFLMITAGYSFAGCDCWVDKSHSSSSAGSGNGGHENVGSVTGAVVGHVIGGVSGEIIGGLTGLGVGYMVGSQRFWDTMAKVYETPRINWRR